MTELSEIEIVDEEEAPPLKAVVVLSGGLDSAVCLAMAVEEKKDWDGFKKCYFRKSKCRRCDGILGFYHESPYIDCQVRNQEFPCFELVTAWERHKWNGAVLKLATVLLGAEYPGSRDRIALSISRLEVSEDWNIEKDILPGGRPDPSFYKALKRTKQALQQAAEQTLCYVLSTDFQGSL